MKIKNYVNGYWRHIYPPPLPPVSRKVASDARYFTIFKQRYNDLYDQIKKKPRQFCFVISVFVGNTVQEIM